MRREADVIPLRAPARLADAPHPATLGDADDADNTIFAARDREDCMHTDTPRRWSRLIADTARELIELAKHPLWSWGFAALDREAPIPIGSLVYIVGATGRGKSSLLAQIASAHESERGPVLIVSAELSAPILAARLVCQAVTGSTWIDVVSGRVPEQVVIGALDRPRMRIVDDIGAEWPTRLDSEIAAMRAEHPGATPLVVVDYVQLCKILGRDVREEVTTASRILRDLAKRHGAVILAISKAGRAASRAIRSGEMVGTDATEAGAESGALEYDAIALVTLGAMAPLDADDPRGAQVVDLSIVKTRFGAADLVIPFLFDGARGLFSVHGDAVPGAQRREEVKEAKRERTAQGKADTITDRRILALELAAAAGTVSIAGYVQRAKNAGLKLGASVAGTELALLREAGLLAADTRGNVLTDAGRALLDRPGPDRRAALRAAVGGES